MAFPITQGAMEDWVRLQGYLKESDMQDYLREQLFVTRDQLRREGYASGDDVRQTVVQVVSDENAQFTALREAMQTLLDSTQALSANFSQQVATATSEFAGKHATTLAELLARDAQLRDYVNETQQGNQQTFELFSSQLASVGDTKQAELGQQVNEMVSSLQGQLARSAKELYDEAMANARTHLSASSQDGGKDSGKG